VAVSENKLNLRHATLQELLKVTVFCVDTRFPIFIGGYWSVVWSTTAR